MPWNHGSSVARGVAAIAVCACALASAPALAAKPAPSDATAEASYVAKQAIDYYKNLPIRLDPERLT